MNEKNIENNIKQAIKLSKPAFKNNIFKLKDEGINKELILKSKEFKKNEPWYFIDKDESIKAVVDLEKIKKIALSMQELRRQNEELRLEKELAKNIPIDFADALSVAKSYALKQRYSSLSQVVESVKKEHPNLFVDIDALMGKKREY